MKNDEATKVFETYLITGHVPYPYELREASKAAITALNSYKQMLENAVKGVAEELYNDGEPQCTVGVGTYFKPGEEVYVIKKEAQK